MIFIRGEENGAECLISYVPGVATAVVGVSHTIARTRAQ